MRWNRLTSISYPDTTSATYGYDVLSRLITATNPTGTVTIAYDNRSRVSSVTDVFGQVVSYSYDANSNRTQLSLNGATNATYQYDVINRLAQLTDNASLATTFAYDATNKLTSRTLPNGVVSSYQYDGLNRLTRLTHAKAPNTLLDLQYLFNAVNNITQMIDNAGTHNYSYDSLDRLTAATHPNQPNESYTYDDVGNRTASHQGASYSYQPFNRLVTANGTSFGYDGNGNQSSKTDGTGSWTYTWDYENRLKQASLSGGIVVNYAYDALGRRVERTSGINGTTRFVYDGGDVIRDAGGSGNLIADYLNGPVIDNQLRRAEGGATSYFIADHLGSAHGFTDPSGDMSSMIEYDSFGNVLGGSSIGRYTYTGREVESDVGILYYRARFYDSKAGRFLSEDPVGLLGGLNLYAYVGNNPTNHVDPQGLWPSQGAWKYHQSIIKRALRGAGISREDLELLATEQFYFDKNTQAEQFAYMHAMRQRGESREDARRKANHFIRQALCLARRHAAKGNRIMALVLVSQAMHTAQDATSPAHANFAVAWENSAWQFVNHAPHYSTELFDPGPASVADDATRKIWGYFNKNPMPDDFFGDLYDLKYGRAYFRGRVSPDGTTCDCDH